MTQNTTTHSEWITLRRDVDMSTGYRGRGKRSLQRTFPKGTRVHYTRNYYNGEFIAHDGDPITAVHHLVSVNHEGEQYSAAFIVPLLSKKLIDGVTITEHKPHEYYAEASELEQTRLNWPGLIPTDIGNGLPFMREADERRDGDLLWVRYKQCNGCVTLTIFND